MISIARYQKLALAYVSLTALIRKTSSALDDLVDYPDGIQGYELRKISDNLKVKLKSIEESVLSEEEP